MKPILLDLFCRAGGTSKGYMDAGFYVVGVDIEFQHSFAGDEFFQCDALRFMQSLIDRKPLIPQCLFTYTDCYRLEDFAAIHSSPPCQAFSALRNIFKGAKEYPNLIPQTRELLVAAGLPYVIENVPGAPLEASVMLCGSMFGLQTDCGAELRRHRLFETNWYVGEQPKCNHGGSTIPFFSQHGFPGMSHERRGVVICVAGDHTRDGSEFTLRAEAKRSNVVSIIGHSAERKSSISVHGDHPRRGDASAERKRLLTITDHSAQANVKDRVISITGATPQQNVEKNRVRECFSIEQARVAMGIDWKMKMSDLSQAIPPAYTNWIGERLLAHLSQSTPKEDESM